MSRQYSHSTIAALFTLCLFSVSLDSVRAAPGNLSQIPLFVAPPTQPNIFFMLDDSGSMHWSMPSDGVSSSSLLNPAEYYTSPNSTKRWNAWCLGANLMAYNPNIEYKPWSANIPGTSNPFPDQTNLRTVWVDPSTAGGGITYTDNFVFGSDAGTKDIRGVPVVQWTDNDGDGKYDSGECPTSYSDSRVKRVDSLSASEQVNFANWFAYYRIREHATKAAVTQVISNSSGRMGMATLHHNNGVGKQIKDMTVSSNKEALLNDIIKINSSGGTPLRERLNWVGKYFSQSSSTPSGLNIGSASSPILTAANGGECQQNFVMLMTDGQWNGSSPGVGSQDSSVDNNFVYPAHKDNVSNTLADIAMKWYKTDLAPGLTDKVPVQSGDNTINLDENSAQHLVTFGVAFGPTGTVSSDPTDRTATFSWPTPVSNQDTTVDDLRHASYNGRGKFLSATNPQTLISSLQDVISDIESRQGSAASVSFNSTSLGAGTNLFFANFDTTNWSGDLRSFSVDPNTGDLSLSAAWSAATKLDGRTNSDMVNTRVIYTWGKDAGSTNDGVLFSWRTTDPKPTTGILDDLKKNQDSTTEASPFTKSIKRLNFIRGDTSNDGTGLIRKRSSRLGDIIASSPLFVGKPLSGWPDNTPFGDVSDRYSSYESGSAASRDSIVYVGANDGMLHGFKSVNGQEVMAYLPSAVSSSNDNEGLHYLTESDYQHRYYVDGSPVSADIYIKTDSAAVSKSWITMLAGTLGGGGHGVYALDVTDPTQYLNSQNAAESIVLWEFTDQDDSDLGLTYSTPEIVMMNNNEWALVLGNGYNATGTDRAKLMILFIEKGIDGQWNTGDYIKIDTGVGDAVNKNGLSTPTLVDLDNDGKTDRIYAGDLHGNMWAFDVSDSNTSNWKVAYEDNSNNPVALFSAGTSKPITMKPLIVEPDWVAETANNKPNRMVYFGTGQYIATGDATNTDQQTIYGIWDAGISVASSAIVEQTFESGFPADARVLSTNSVVYASNPSTGNLGWFVDLPETGERVVVNALERAGSIFFNTMTPSSTPCSAGGDGWQMAVNSKTGGNPTIVSLDYTGDGILDDSDKVLDSTSGDKINLAGVKFGYGIASATAMIETSSGKAYGYTSGTSSLVPIKSPLPAVVSATGSRRSWIQLFN